MFKFFIRGINTNPTYMYSKELAMVIDADISLLVGLIDFSGNIYRTDLNISIYNKLEEYVKEKSIIEVDFFQVYEMLSEEYRERFTKNMYDLYNTCRSVKKAEYYIGEIIIEENAASYDKAARRGTCVQYLYIEVDSASKNIIQQKIKGGFRVSLKAINENELYLCNCQIPIDSDNKTYYHNMQTPAEFGSIQEATLAISKTRHINKYAFNIPMIFKKNSDGTYTLIRFSM